jgi:hypothetical protein
MAEIEAQVAALLAAMERDDEKAGTLAAVGLAVLAIRALARIADALERPPSV